MTRPTIPTELAAIVGDAFVVVDPDLTARYRVDWTGRYGGADAVVVRPGSTAEVAAVVAWAAARGVALVPQGGNTGLVGGSVPERAGSVVMSTERLVALGEVDAVAGQVTVGAGVTPSMLADHVRGTGWRFAVDLGARDTATIGGM
ncbi:MAG TPA: FAD-binding protein, partial [Microthrixaceae bacterium]|nr:FAD-binding protein [Microthrixaceae bacterium]